MKYINIIVILIVFIKGQTVYSQYNSEYGWITNPKGVMRVLVIFAEIDYTNCGPDPYIAQFGPNPQWAAGSLPTFANQIFDTDYTPGILPTNDITDYFFQHSLGNYIVLGDYYPNVVTIPCNQANSSYTVKEVISYLNAQTTPITTYSGKTLNDFDLETNTGKYQAKTSASDNIIDNIMIYWRNNGIAGGMNYACQSGAGLQPTTSYYSGSSQIQSSNISDPNYNPNYKSGVANTASFRTCSYSDAVYMTKLEYFHALFGDNNWHTAGGAGYYTFLSPPANFALSGQSNATSVQPCAWDRNQLGWLGWSDLNRTTRKSMLISAKTTTNTDANSDLTISNNSSGGQFVLRDFQTYGDAIRLKLPHINYASAGDVKNQYIWIENHQKLSFTNTGFINQRDFIGNNPTQNSCTNATPAGLFAYVQVGKDVKASSTSIQYTPNELGSWIFPLPAEGRFDFKYRYDLLQSGTNGCANWGNTNLPLDKATSKQSPNPFTGFSDLFQIGQSASNSSNFSNSKAVGLSQLVPDGSCNNSDIPATSPNWVCHDWYGHGDELDAFSSTIGKTTINIGTNPSTATVYTYKSSGGGVTYSWNGSSWYSYENFKIYLNGLQIKILQENYNPSTFGPGAMLIDIKWDNYDISNDARWCGDIVLQNDINDPLSRSSKINILDNNTITLDQGKSPTRLINGILQTDGTYLFADPTRLKLHSSTITSLQPGAQLKVINGSTLGIKNGATVQLNKNSMIMVDNSSMLCIENTNDIQFLDPSAGISIGNQVYYGSFTSANPTDITYTSTTLPNGVIYYNNITTGSNVVNSNLSSTMLKAVNSITFGQGTIISCNDTSSLGAFIQPNSFSNSCSSVSFREIPKEFNSGISKPADDIQSHSIDANLLNYTHEVSVNIYPNPADDIITVYSENSHIKSIRVMDIAGKVQQESCMSTMNQSCQLNLNSLPNGIYFIKIETTDGTTTLKKLIKK